MCAQLVRSEHKGQGFLGVMVTSVKITFQAKTNALDSELNCF